MPIPSGSSRHIDQALVDVSIAFQQDSEDSIARAVPWLPVKRSSDKYHIFDTATWNKRQARRRAPGDPAAEGGYTVSNDQYVCELFSIKHKQPREDLSDADEVFDVESDNTEWATGQSMLEADSLVAAAIMQPGVWDTDVDGVGAAPVFGTSVLQWDKAGSDPITDVVKLGGLVKKRSTKNPTLGVMGRGVWDQLLNHTQIIDRTKHTSSDSIRMEIIAQLFELDRIMVAGLTENTAAEGQPEDMNFIVADNDFGMFYFPDSPGKKKLSAAYVYAFDGEEYQEGTRVVTWYSDDKNSDMTQVDLYIDVKIVATSAAAFIDNVIPAAP